MKADPVLDLIRTGLHGIFFWHDAARDFVKQAPTALPQFLENVWRGSVSKAFCRSVAVYHAFLCRYFVYSGSSDHSYNFRYDAHVPINYILVRVSIAFQALL